MQTAGLSRRLRNISASRADAGKPRASPSLRITHVDVCGGGRDAPGTAAHTLLAYAHIRVRAYIGHTCALRVDLLARLRRLSRHALARVLRTPTRPRARFAPTQRLCTHTSSAGRLNRCAVQAEPASSGASVARGSRCLSSARPRPRAGQQGIRVMGTLQRGPLRTCRSA